MKKLMLVIIGAIGMNSFAHEMILPKIGYSKAYKKTEAYRVANNEFRRRRDDLYLEVLKKWGSLSVISFATAMASYSASVAYPHFDKKACARMNRLTIGAGTIAAIPVLSAASTVVVAIGSDKKIEDKLAFIDVVGAPFVVMCGVPAELVTRLEVVSLRKAKQQEHFQISQVEALGEEKR